MSERKFWSDFNRLYCGKTEKIFAGTWSFNKDMEISSSVKRMVLQDESKLEKNESNDADTFYNSWYCSVPTFSSRLPFMPLNISKFMLTLAEV